MTKPQSPSRPTTENARPNTSAGVVDGRAPRGFKTGLKAGSGPYSTGYVKVSGGG